MLEIVFLTPAGAVYNGGVENVFSQLLIWTCFLKYIPYFPIFVYNCLIHVSKKHSLKEIITLSGVRCLCRLVFQGYVCS